MDDFERQRRYLRRKLAVISFVLLSGKSILVTGMVMFSADRLDIAEAVNKISGTTNMILGAYVTIILGYLTASGFDYMNRMKKGVTTEDDR